MKILLVSQEYPPETGWGGIGTYIKIISRALAQAGHEVHVLSAVHGQESRSYDDDGVRVHRRGRVHVRGAHRFSKLPRTYDRLSVAWSAWREYCKLGERFDVIECPEWNAEGLLFALRRPAPVVVRLHSGARQVLGFLNESGADARTAIRLEDVAIRRADLVTGTHSQTSSLDHDVRSHAVQTIPYPVVHPELAPPAAGRPTVFFAGRLEPRKSPETIVRAAPKVLAAVPDARFLLVGTDSAQPGRPSYVQWLYDTASRLGVAHAVQIEERWGAAAVADGLRRATVSAVPSRWESFGYVAAEAAAAGRPVVASDIPSVADVVDDGVTGHLVALDDFDAWAQALAGLLADPHRARAMGLAGRALVETKFDPACIAAATVDAYRAAAAGRHPASPVPARQS